MYGMYRVYLPSISSARNYELKTPTDLTNALYDQSYE